MLLLLQVFMFSITPCLLRIKHHHHHRSVIIFLIILACNYNPLIITSVNGNSNNDEIDFPAMIDSDDISYFSSTYDIEGLHWALSSIFTRSERNPNVSQIKHKLQQSTIAKGGGSTYTTEYKLKMDLEQAEYIISDESKYASKEIKEYFRLNVIPIYKYVLSNIPPLETLDKTGGLYAFNKDDYNIGIANVYNKALHVPDIDIDDKKLLTSLNENELSRIYSDWNKHGIVIIDNLLTKSALSDIHSLLLESTIFYQTKMPFKFGGYAGAYIDDGLHSKILLRLAFELHKSLSPDIMKKEYDLKYMWAYKYDERYNGIMTHADQAAINVNIWITPDEANLDKDTGGLVIYTAKPPSNWDFNMYNMNTEQVSELLLKPTNFNNVTIPYKQNRAVIFDSALFHHTDSFNFNKGYKNRRINLTILYGNMQLGSTGSGDDSSSSTGDNSDGEL